MSLLTIKKVTEIELLEKASNFDYFCFYSEDNYLIYNNNRVVGFLCGKYNNLNNDLFIEIVELHTKGKGLGKVLVKELFNQLNLNSISGKVLYEDNHRPYYFWKSVGADIEDKLSEYVNKKDSELPFSILNPLLVLV